MDFLRKGFDEFYDLIKPIVFKTTARNPEMAHSLFVTCCNTLDRLGLEKLVFDNKMNTHVLPYEISNAAGFNKHAEISLRVLKYLGFDRVVIGTVTNDSWEGNPKPRIKRFVKTKSLVNWMGLPGVGAEKTAKRLIQYGNHNVPLTINLMSTPEKSGKDLLKDLTGTISKLKDVPYVDRFELNISCPNTHGSGGSIDSREEYKNQLEGMLDVTQSNINTNQDLYLKVSPDLNEAGVDEILRVCDNYSVKRFVIGNSTTNHNPKYITEKMDQGGASGDAVYDDSLRIQKLFAERVSKDTKIIACGGISSVERVKERVNIGNVSGIQIFTPLIFRGTRLLRELRRMVV